jgi:SNF2 family DNA or RNA helicase
MDLYGIMTCVDTDRFMTLTASQFQAKYVKIGGAMSIKRLMDSIEPFTVFANLEDHIEMPGYEDIVIPVPMSIADRVALDTACRSDKNALARIIDAQRITSNIHGNKSLVARQLIHDIIDDGRKVVIFTKFDDEFDFFTSWYGDICVGINGKTKDRETPVYEFQNNPDIKVFVGNLQTASMGLTLTAATDCIFYSETYTWGDADQSRARIYRIGQKQPCRYYHLLVSNTIDELIYMNLSEKTDLIEEFKKIYGGN